MLSGAPGSTLGDRDARSRPRPHVGTAYNHHSLLRTTEDSWALSALAANDAAAAAMRGFI